MRIDDSGSVSHERMVNRACSGLPQLPWRQVAEAAYSAAARGVQDVDAFVAQTRLNRYVGCLDTSDPNIRRALEDVFGEQKTRAREQALTSAGPHRAAMESLLDRGLTIGEAARLQRTHGGRTLEAADGLLGRNVSMTQIDDLLDRYGGTGASTIDQLLAHGGKAVKLPEAIDIADKAYRIATEIKEVFDKGGKLMPVPPALTRVPETVERLVSSGRLEDPIYLKRVLAEIRTQALEGRADRTGGSRFGMLWQLGDAADRASAPAATRPVAIAVSRAAEPGHTRQADVIDLNPPRGLPAHEADAWYRGEVVSHRDLASLRTAEHEFNCAVRSFNGSNEPPPRGFRRLIDVRLRPERFGGDAEAWNATWEELRQLLGHAEEARDASNLWHEVRISNGTSASEPHRFYPHDLR